MVKIKQIWIIRGKKMVQPTAQHRKILIVYIYGIHIYFFSFLFGKIFFSYYHVQCLFGKNYFCQLILLFNLFLLLFMSLIVLFQLIFTFIYSTFSKKNFNFSKISKFQMNHYYDEVYSKRIDYGGNENNRLQYKSQRQR